MLYRMLFPETVWRIHSKPHTVYLTFDDGPIPEVTPWVLDVLDHYGIKATFFMVGENVLRYHDLYNQIIAEGHQVGNHSYDHAQLDSQTCAQALADLQKNDDLLQELRMGVTRRQALTRLARRCGIQEMQLFTAAIIQADKLGVGMAQTLEIQSGNMREARRQRAKEEAAKLPVKILFPTMIFIFPVMFVVVLGPAIVSLINSMGK